MRGHSEFSCVYGHGFWRPASQKLQDCYPSLQEKGTSKLGTACCVRLGSITVSVKAPYGFECIDFPMGRLAFPRSHSVT